ncbi:RsmB/NOP family class I SAM-dependent RNA methyltransferase [Stomatohabitans albus]|uniref:RsmB/NOP family class I SAM-dependent RNA methyltransferase n=1 Tax=Stomatohabitans albus TaxID=3110766 RepID=UPI00300C2826
MSGIGDQRPKRKAVRKSVSAKSQRADQYKAAKSTPTKAEGGKKQTTGSGNRASATGSGRKGHTADTRRTSHPAQSRHSQRQPGRMPSARTTGHNKGSGVRTRRLAASVLARVERDDSWATPILDEALTQTDLDGRDKAFVSNLVFSTIRMQGTLDAVLNQVLHTPIDQLDPQVRATLRVGTWELLAGHAPDHAVVKSHVDAIAKASKSRHFVGFTNGVLRGVIRQRQDFDWLGATTFPHDRAMAFGLGYPLWVVEFARERFGDRAQRVLEASNTPAPTILRAIGSVDALLNDMHDAGIEVTAHQHIPGALVVRTRGRGGDLPWVQQGRAVIQDAASQAVVLAAVDAMNAGDRAVDLCAAPGGKTIALAQHDVAVQANDLHDFRLQRLRDMADQFGLTIPITVGDARTFTPEGGLVDLVLLDAPCSGLGVMRRRPEIRWRQQPDDITGLATLQGELFDAAVRMVKPGGKLVYSVCTWTTAETDDVVRTALTRHPNVSVQGVPIDVGTNTEFGVQLAPDTDETDGMYIAVFRVE